MPVTIRDVALAASVSPATVSRALNRSAEVAAPLRERVLAAVAELGYRPNGPARSLRRRATTVLGIIVSDVTNPFFTSVVRGAEDVAQAAGYSVILANADEDLEKEARYLEVAAAEQLAGVVLSPASSTRTRIDVLAERGIPVVTFDRNLRGVGVDAVTVNNRRAARDATLHLLDQGCRRIAIIAGPGQTSTAAERLAGYRAALLSSGLPFDRRLVVHGDYRVEGGRAATARLLAGELLPDGLFVSNNLMTLGAVDALLEAGMRLPQDVAVIGFDDLTWGLGHLSHLSMVVQPTYDMGRQATELLLRRVQREDFPLQRRILETTLTIRASSLRQSGATMTLAR